MVAQADPGEWRLSVRALTALVLASLFVTNGATGVYDAIGRQAPSSVSALGTLMVSLSVIAWFRGYSRQHGIPWVFDMGAFLLALWYLIVPYYLLREEGWRGLRRIATFLLTYAVAAVAGAAAVGAVVAKLLP